LSVKGIDPRWPGLRETLSVQRRVTARFTRKDARTLNVRRATQPEPKLMVMKPTCWKAKNLGNLNFRKLTLDRQILLPIMPPSRC